MLYQEELCTILNNSVLCFPFRKKNDGLWTTTLLSFFSAIIFTYIVSKHTAVTKKSYYFLCSAIKLVSFPEKKPYSFFYIENIQFWKCEKNCQTVSKWQKKKSMSNGKKWSRLLTDIFCHFKFSIIDSVCFIFTKFYSLS